jgi:hypothetical protein
MCWIVLHFLGSFCKAINLLVDCTLSDLLGLLKGTQRMLM